MRVELTEGQQRVAQLAAERRFARRRSAGSSHRWNRGDDHSVEKERDAIGAEMAAGVSVGRGWVDSPEPDHDGDLGPGLQVRFTEHERGRLLLHESDEDDHLFILVTGQFPVYMVRGQISGAEGKRVGVVRELRPGRPCVCVEQHQLEPAPGPSRAALT